MKNNLKRAVIADDDEFFRLALAAILTRHFGFTEVIETASLDEALAQLDMLEMYGESSLALFDLLMPGMSGAGSLTAVRDCFPKATVVVVSGSTRRFDILSSLEAGAHGYVPKSLGPNVLATAIEQILSGMIYVPNCLAEASMLEQPRILMTDPSLRKDTAHGDASRGGFSDTGREAVLQSLTRRQRDVLNLLVDGKANKEIARALCLSEGTVKVHVAALLRTLGVNNRTSAASAGARLLAGDKETIKLKLAGT